MFECNDGHSFYVIGNKRCSIDNTPIEQVILVYLDIQQNLKLSREVTNET